MSLTLVNSFFGSFETQFHCNPRVSSIVLFSSIACAQLCGITHYRMRGYLTVDTEDEYNDWLASEAEYLDFGDDDGDDWGDDDW